MSNVITIFADASFVDWQGIKAGGFAWWCRGDGEERVRGSQEWPARNIDETETIGLAWAMIEALEKLPPLNPGGALVLQSDSLKALGHFKWCGVGITAKESDRPILNRRGAADAEKFIKRAQQMVPKGSRIYLKHIKAHTGSDDRRSWVNEWCDKEAKRARRELYERLRAAQRPTVLAVEVTK